MTTLREAAQQALEALMDDQYRMVEVAGGHYEYKTDLAIGALKAALAQEQAEPVQGKRTFFILTREINEYDQDGEYFVEVFDKKPSLSLLAENGVPQDRLEHVLKGGGRVGNEYEWFHLSAHNIKE